MENNQQNTKRISAHPLISVGLISGLLLLAACQPIRDPAVIAAEQTAVAAGEAMPASAETQDATPAETPTPSAVDGVEPATATIATRSLRVRALPSDDADVVAAVIEGDSFPVTGISSDGEWIQVSIEEGPDGLGWVSAEFVTLAGDITNIVVVDVEISEATEEVTEEATEEVVEEATPEATEEAMEEATPEATEEVMEEATPEATEEVMEEATPEATEEVVEEATPEATEEVIEEATPEATEEVIEEATPEATEEAIEEATPEPTDEATTPDLGTVTILVELPLRVRSEPTTEVENKIGSVYNLEVYTVLEVSEDGSWVRIETPQFPEGSGWISAEFVVFNEAE